MADHMEFDFYIRPDGGDPLPLAVPGSTGGQKKFLEAGASLIDGLIRFFTRRGPLQDGATVTFMRLDERHVQMTLSNQASCREDYWRKRAVLLNNFRPNRWTDGPYCRPIPGTLRKVLPDGSIRDLEVFVERVEIPPDDVERVSFPHAFRAYIEFLAANPLYLAEEITASYTLAGAGGLRFPAAFEPDAGINRWLFGGATLFASSTLTNSGTRYALPTITAAGPLEYLSVSNTTTGEAIEFNGEVNSDRTLTIDLGYGQKRAYDDAGDDFSGYLDGDVGEFHIACEPEAENGENDIQVSLVGGDANTLIEISFRPPYVGI